MAGKRQSAKGVKPDRTDVDRSVEKPNDPVRLTVSVEQAGRILGISRGSAFHYAREGVIPTIRLGKRLLVPKAALDRLLGSV